MNFLYLFPTRKMAESPSTILNFYISSAMLNGLGYPFQSLFFSLYYGINYNKKEKDMRTTTTDTSNIPRRETITTDRSGTMESSASAVSWQAIIAGAVTAIAVSFILFILGSGLGLSSISPWSPFTMTATSFTIMAAVWLIVMQFIASGLGGYITGRLRTKWAGHNDEVFFRDSAHGFLAWVVATVLTIGLLASAASSVVSGSVGAVTTVASSAVSSATQAAAQNLNTQNPVAYLVDSLFRTSPPSVSATEQDIRAETTRIIMSNIAKGDFPETDRNYIAQVVATRTGVSPTEARRRVDEIVVQINNTQDQARQAAETARKTGARVSLFIFLSMLVGAFIASVGATVGGKHRDRA